MKTTDVELINRILNGDDTAFTELVKKYQKPVHALVWRKIGDFHIAEEITQDTFLKAYQGLAALKKPQRFASWLYVIAANNCSTWLRKKRVWTQPLEDTDISQFGKATYSRYVVEENERTAVEAQREVVKKLLAKLPESERTVITLHYFSEMSSAEIGAFLGVSANTIRSRIRRAQQRLQKEETMIREALEHFQISPNLTDNIMREVARLKPATPTGGKPLVPWAIAVSSIVFILLMLGIGSQHLVRFQQPYSLDAQTETMVELVDAPIVLNLDTKPDVRRELGNSNARGENQSNGQKPDEVLLANAQVEGEDVSVPKRQWIQSKPIEGTMVEGLLATSEGAFYTLARGHIYKLQDDYTGWRHISDISTLIDDTLIDIPMAEWDNTLYIVPSNKLYASNDDGKTWDLVHEFPEEYDFPELLLTKQAFYIIFDKGVFRSEDKGKTWKNMKEELSSEPNSVVVVQDTVFVLTNAGFYRWNSDSWQRLEFPIPKGITSITATKDRLYAIAINYNFDPDKAAEGERGWWIFRSTDLGNSWKDITPTHVWKERVGWLMGINLYAAGETLIAMEQGMVRSTDGGDTWTPLQKHGKSLEMFSNSPAAVLNESIFYFGSPYAGLQRSIDDGKSWEVVNVNSDKSYIGDLIVHKENDKAQNTLPIIYGSVGDMIKTTDKGKSWKTIPADIPLETEHFESPPDITQIVESNGIIYAKGNNLNYSHFGKGEPFLFRLSTDGNTLVRIQDMPIFDPIIGQQLINRKRGLSNKAFAEQLQERSSGATKFFIMLAKMARIQQANLRQFGLKGPFAVSGDTFYMEYNFKLFRWKPGGTEWYDTEQEETVELPLHIASRDLKLAALGNTVYVGKRDGRLVVSFDKGNNWIDLTPALPFPFKTFKEIVFVGPTVYVATDAGVAASDSGKNWRAITDAEGTNLIMEHLAVDGTTVYGVTEKLGAYRLENDTWKQVVSEIPDNVTSLAVDGDTLYVGTENNGMFHFTLKD
jgi:RNA polymerase sigma factor (sigma-70 family)